MKHNITTPLLAVLALLLAIPSAVRSQDDLMDNPRLNPRPMTLGTGGIPTRTIPSQHPRQLSRVPTDWNHWIDTSWGEGMSTQEKLELFDWYWNLIDQQYGGFPNLNIDWDSLRDHYRPMVEAGVSEGRFYGIMTHLALALRELHIIVYDGSVESSFDAGDGKRWPLTRLPLVKYGGAGYNFSGFGVAPMPDSSLFVYDVQPGNPLDVRPGDLVLGYDGKTWKDILHLIDSVDIPIQLNYSMYGSDEEANEYYRLTSAATNWWLFDTIDVVRYETGDTVHLSTQPLADAAPLWETVLFTDQLPVPGVPMPDYPNDDWCSWGILEGTSIGYIYLAGLTPSGISAQFAQAVEELKNTTTGLILDMRVNIGGDTRRANAGLSLLFNENFDQYYRGASRTDPGDHFGFTFSSTGWEFPPSDQIYDHPIAVLTGPLCYSAGDMTAFRMRFHPMARFFGKRTNTSYVWGISDIVRDPWYFKISRGSGYSLYNGEGFLIHKGFDVDEAVWHNRDDAADGVDAVVERARVWIDSACYAHDVSTDKVLLVPWTDTLQISAVVENPADHPISVKALLYRDGELMDSVDLVQDTSYFPQPKGACLGSWPAPPNGGTYEVTVKTTDPLTGRSFHLRRLAEVTVAGPVIAPSGIDFGITHSDSAMYDTLRVYNPSEYSLHISSAASDLLSVCDVSPPSAIVPAHDSATFVVTFDPASYVVYDGHIVFTHDGAGSPSMVGVKGIYSIQSAGIHVEGGWNMLSVPMQVEDYSARAVFPGSGPVAWHYSRGYHAQPVLVPGEGYWLKFAGAGVQEIPGLPVMADTVSVAEGWNIVGSITYPVAVSSIGSNPGGIMTTAFYCYNGDAGYEPEDTIKPGCAAWVKVSQEGQLILSAGEAMPLVNRIRIELADELPPPPPEGGEVTVEQPVPTEYLLEQNYPNPFNPVTTISYALPTAGHVRLSVFNILGQEVAVLVNEVQAPGSKSVTFDAGGLPSGVYTYRLIAGTFTSARRMLMVK